MSRRILPYAAVFAALAVIVSFVVASRGVQNQVMDLNNSGIWVTNDAQGLWGRVNRSAGTLDAAVSDRERESLTGYIDVFQDGEAVVAWTKDESRLFAVDTRDVVASADPPVAVVKLSSVAMGGGILATISADKGEVRTTPYSAAAIADVSGLNVDRPVAAALEVVSGLESGVDIAVDSRGRVFAASASGAWALIDEAGDVTYGSVNQSLRGVAASLVGGVGVIADSISGDVFLTNGVSQQVGAGVVPQQPSSDGNRVIVATPSGLSSLTVSNGSLTTMYDLPPGSGVNAGGRMIARPVVMGALVYGAWGGIPGHWVRIDGESIQDDIFPADGTALSRPAFRVNRGSVLLNDMATGAVYDVDEKWAMNQWDDVDPDTTDLSGDSKSSEDSPQATDDHVWARAGRLSVIHVLDNDQNPGTGLVAITEVSGQDAGRVVISPDGQSLVADVPQGQTDDMTLKYTITNRAVDPDKDDVESSANVTISVRPLDEDSPPYQMGNQGKDETSPDFTVPSAGFLAIAPAGSWRDPDSDQVSIVAASVGDRTLPVTAQGLIQYTAQATGGKITEKLDYLASDGFGQTVPGAVYISVMPDSAIQAIPPMAMPDSVRGVAGREVVFYPLDNDVPGCDPLDKQARLTLASPVGTRVGIQVSTDLLSGAVTVSADRAGAYFLDYTVSYGAGFDTGKIRVDIVADDTVIAMPDTAVIHGTVPAVVDALSNDRDPYGSVLTITSATPRDPDRVRVGIIAGRWLQIDPVSSMSNSAAMMIDYVMTNGVAETQGQVNVSLLPGVDPDHVSVVDDVARVRVGDVTTINVLDNDSSESGEPLVLNDNSMATAGQLYVDDPTAPSGQQTVNVGQAFVDGNRIRYEAPTSGESRRVRIEYQAGVASSPSPTTGHVWVDVVAEPVAPDPSTPATMTGNNVPTPISVEARVIVGDAVRVPIGIYGQDPDGDSVTVAGLRTPPKYGRVVDVGADFLTYESYPEVRSEGEDSFQFYVQDRFGAIGIGTVRVGLSSPHDVPPPLGIDDVVTAQPNVSVTVFPTSNDVVAIGTGQTQIVLDDPSAARVDQESASVVTTAPGENEAAMSLGYHLDAGGVLGTSAQIMVRSQVGYLNPPNVFDHAAENVDNGVASVDVLEDAWDVDGPDSAIHIVSVGAAGTFDGATVSVPILDRGQVVPYVVEDGDGAQAMAVVFVPSLTDGRPTLISGGLIHMDRNGDQQVSLNDYIESPRNQSVHLTLASQAWTAPSQYLDVSVDNDEQVTLRAKNDYVGPAALTVEVRDSADATDPTALTGVVTIPVQIGAATPVLWCPEDVQLVVQGGVARSLDIAELCHAWMPTQTEIDALTYDGSWSQGGDEIAITGRDQGSLPSDMLTLQALAESRPGVDSTLLVSVDGYEGVTGQLTVRVVAAPPPTISVSSVADVQAATTVEVPVTVTSPMLGAVQNIVSVTPTSAFAANVRFDERTIEVTPDASSHGVLTFDVVGSDVADNSRTDRQVTGTFSVGVFGVPDPPSPPQPGTQLRSGSAVVTFQPGSDNGAPILSYEVKWDGGSMSCGLNTTCEIPGLANGTSYRFQVRAINKAGTSEWSEAGTAVVPNAIPGAVLNFTASAPGCGSVVLKWAPPQGEATPPTMYHLTWVGAQPVTVNGSDVTYTPTGLDNNMVYTFTIVAENEAGMGQQSVTVQGQSSCKPVWPATNVTVVSQDMGDTAQIQVSWPAADPQGPSPVTYKVTRTGPDGTKQFAPTTELTMGDTGDEITYDGQSYVYHVVAVNATGGNEHTSDEISGSFTAISAPASWSTVGGSDAVKIEATGDNGRVKISVVSFPKFRDSSGEVRVNVGGQTLTLTPGNASRTLDGFTNGTDLTASFTACNSQQICNAPQSVSLAGGSFGPLTAPVISAKQGSDKNVCVTASGDGNGRGATLVVTADNGIGEVYRSATLSVPDKCVDALSWDTSITFTARLESVTTTPARGNSANASASTRSAVGTPDPWAPGAVHVVATGANGQVILSASPLPVSNGGTLRLWYTVDGGPQIVMPMSNGEGRVTVGSLTNGTTYSFRVIADNGTNTSTSEAATTHPYGPLGTPILTALDGQDVKACVQATTPASGTNGEAASLVIKAGDTEVYRSNPQVGAIDSDTQCWPAGDYNTNLEFTAQLVTAANLERGDSPVATRTARSSVGTPGALSPSNIVWAATGHSQEIHLELTGTLPAHNGGANDHLEVRVSGLPSGSLILTQATPSGAVTGFENGTPTTLTFTPCNAKNCGDPVQVIVTSVGALSVPTVVSFKPPEGTMSPDKTVCVEFTAEANGGLAKLEVTNLLDTSKKTSSSGTGTVTAPELCVDADAPEMVVQFTATFTDEANLQYDRDLQVVTEPVTSARDAGPMTMEPLEPQVTYNGTTARVCLGFSFNPNGGDAEIEVAPGEVNNDETWDTPEAVTIPGDGGPVERRLCATIPTDGRNIFMQGWITDKSAYNRTTLPITTDFSVKDVPQMTLDPPTLTTSVLPGTSIKQACVLATAHGGTGFAVELTVTAPDGPHTAGGDVAAVQFCIDNGPGQTANFTFSVSDQSGYGRTLAPQTQPITSPADNAMPIGDITLVTGPGTITVTGWSIDPDTTAPSDVHIYVGGPAGDPNAGGCNAEHANLPSTAIPAEYAGYGPNHGINFVCDFTGWTGTQQAWIYLIDSTDVSLHAGPITQIITLP